VWDSIAGYCIESPAFASLLFSLPSAYYLYIDSKKLFMNRLLSVLATATLVSLFAACTKVDSGDLKDDVPYYQSYSVSYNKTGSKAHHP